MAAGYVQVATDGPGKKTQTFVNTIGADSVHAEGTVLVDSAGIERTTIPVTELAATNPAGTTMQNAATANGNGTLLNVQGYTTAILNIVSSPSMSGGTTVNFEASYDDSVWFAVTCERLISVALTTYGQSTTQDGDYRLNVAIFKSIRARISGYSAGTVTVKGYVSPHTYSPPTVLTYTTLGSGGSVIGSLLVAGNTMLTGNGITGTGSQRVTIASDNTPFPVKIDQTTPGTTNAVQDIPAASGGLSKFHLVAAATDNATSVKASAGQVYSITAFNLNAAARYLKFHNTAGTPTAGSGVTDTYLIPGNTAGAGLVINIDKGIAFGTGIGITIVTGITDASTTAVAASEIVVNIYYK